VIAQLESADCSNRDSNTTSVLQHPLDGGVDMNLRRVENR
jgi:hypothetical protein